MSSRSLPFEGVIEARGEVQRWMALAEGQGETIRQQDRRIAEAAATHERQRARILHLEGITGPLGDNVRRLGKRVRLLEAEADRLSGVVEVLRRLAYLAGRAELSPAERREFANRRQWYVREYGKEFDE